MKLHEDKLLTMSSGNAFALFLQSQRKWDNKPLLDENRLAFISMCEEHKYNASDHVLPHGSYLVNLAQEEKGRAKQAYDHFLDDLRRCEALGIKMYNFHPGAAGKAPLPEAINRISTQLNRALAETQTAIPVLENMCGSGSVIGSRFSDLRDIIAGIKPEYKARIGVCIDTCHAFAAGYDLRTPEAFRKTIQEFDDVVGLKYLKGLHLNDSKGPFGSHRDLHQNIGLGFLGLRAFHNVMNEPRFHNMPMILETPCDRIDPSDPTGKKTIEDKATWAREIKLLESLIGMDPESDEFKSLEQELSEKGRASREKMQYAIDQKNKKAKKMPEKGQRSLVDMMGKKNKNKNKMKMESTENSSLSDEEEVDD
jgi:AP endonuclease-1